MIVICFKSLKGGARLKQFLSEISNVTNGICSMDDCLAKFEILLNSNNGINTGAPGSNNNPIIIS